VFSLLLGSLQDLRINSLLVGKLEPRKVASKNLSEAGGVAQAVECLLCKCETLSSNPSPPRKKKKRKKNFSKEQENSHQPLE
jgi:hypothetical protein